MIPQEAIEAAEQAIRKEMESQTYDQHTYTRIALEAAAPFLRAKALEELTANSPRLPSDIRNAVFELVFDVVDKFNFPAQNCGTLKDVVEIGDVCGDVERRIVALLRARAATERGRHD